MTKRRYSILINVYDNIFSYKNIYIVLDSNEYLESFIRHGLFGSRTNWRSLAKAFSRQGNIKVWIIIQYSF